MGLRLQPPSLGRSTETKKKQNKKQNSNSKPFCIINTLKPNCTFVKVIKLTVSVNR